MKVWPIKLKKKKKKSGHFLKLILKLLYGALKVRFISYLESWHNGFKVSGSSSETKTSA